MSKPPKKRVRNRIMNIESALLERWNNAIYCIDNNSYKTMDTLLKSIKKIIENKITHTVLENGWLLDNDEKAYVCYYRLIESYKEIIDIYEKEKLVFSNINATKIYDGIYSILNSRLKLFNENGIRDKDHNPILNEKKHIINNCILANEQSIINEFNKFKEIKISEIIDKSRKTLIIHTDYLDMTKLINIYYDEISNTSFKAFYDYYSITVRDGVTRLKDLEQRNITSYYLDAINQEREMLTTIIQIQSGALENYLDKGNENNLTLDRVKLVLEKLREVHQLFGKEIDSILNLFQTNRKIKNELSFDFIPAYEIFKSYVDEKIDINSIYPQESYQKFSESFSKSLELFSTQYLKLAINIFDEQLKIYSPLKEFYEFKKNLTLQEIMDREIITVFSSISEYMGERLEYLNNTENADIIAGIYETMKIKVESLSENSKMFNSDFELFLNNLYENKFVVSDSEKNQYLESNYLNLLNELVVLNNNQNILTEIKHYLIQVKECELINSSIEKLNKQKIKDSELVEKKINGYNKDYLLFEVTTFEEILYYSVSILRNSTDINLVELVKFIDEKHILINNILVRNGIELIIPEPHEMFNAKENEVLIAEKNEEFKKGEIIKLINSGFKRDGTIIIRANVIAAK